MLRIAELFDDFLIFVCFAGQEGASLKFHKHSLCHFAQQNPQAHAWQKLQVFSVENQQRAN